ncbi:unnamed protein product [Protopolystoma xenopodis]|uniref:Uncharacterized protein n=1 Tax=Protopolystoma xenopodis TaxID=117903 RepID=A0A448WB23_9PLAT|nr:unnamed protein product [Protopolystoma xenopodis]
MIPSSMEAVMFLTKFLGLKQEVEESLKGEGPLKKTCHADQRKACERGVELVTEAEAILSNSTSDPYSGFLDSLNSYPCSGSSQPPHFQEHLNDSQDALRLDSPSESIGLELTSPPSSQKTELPVTSLIEASVSGCSIPSLLAPCETIALVEANLVVC